MKYLVLISIKTARLVWPVYCIVSLNQQFWFGNEIWRLYIPLLRKRERHVRSTRESWTSRGERCNGRGKQNRREETKTSVGLIMLSVVSSTERRCNWVGNFREHCRDGNTSATLIRVARLAQKLRWKVLRGNRRNVRRSFSETSRFSITMLNDAILSPRVVQWKRNRRIKLYFYWLEII